MDLAPGKDALHFEAKSCEQAAAIHPHKGRLVSGEGTEVEAVEGRLTDPPQGGVENAARAPGRSASSQRTPWHSRHFILVTKQKASGSIGESIAARHGQGGGELLLAPDQLPVKLAPQRLS